MDLRLLGLHSKLIVIVITSIAFSLLFTLSNGEFKPSSVIEWPDILGEGGIALITLIWIFFLLISRPAGKVTSMLTIGLLFLHVSLLLDLMDEFLVYNANSAWITMYESVPAPVGMILMTMALYHWHKEQLSLNYQLRRRERIYREHGLTDFITGLYSADYMFTQLRIETAKPISTSATFSLIMLDLDKFDSFVLKFGDKRGDRCLREISEILLLNIGQGELACRYAGDRFIVLLPGKGIDVARLVEQRLVEAVGQFGFIPDNNESAYYLKVTSAIATCRPGETPDQILMRLNSSMEEAKLKSKLAA